MKKVLFTILLMLLPMLASAQNAVKIDGIYYILNFDAMTAEVTESPSLYTGDVSISETIEYGKKSYRVTAIGNSAFKNCIGLTSVTIPNSVTSIGNSAFKYCIGLTSVTIPNSVTSIGESAFSSCLGLTSITIPDGVTFIGSRAFDFCSGLTSVTIGNGVTSIDDWAFDHCSSLTSISIPNSVTFIGEGAFVGCSSLTSFVVDEDNTIYKSMDGLLMSKDGKTIVAYPYGNRDLYYTIPDGVTSIGSLAFCSSFVGSVVIPDGVITIGDRAFLSCASLNSVTIGSGVTYIGDRAFSLCYSLFNVTCHREDVPMTGNDVFYDSNARTLHVPVGSVEAYKAAEPWNQFEEIVALPVKIVNLFFIVDTEAKTAEMTKSPDKYQGDVAIPESFDYGEETYNVTTIGDYAFYECSGLTSVTIPNSVTSIGDGAFYGCTGLTSITIPNSVTSIGDDAFSGCSSLTSITVDEANTYFKSVDGVLMSKAGTELIAYPAGKTETAYTIPDGVTDLGNGAFTGCTGLTSVTIPNSVTAIGIGAFTGCTGLTSITIPDGVTSIDSGVFSGCSGLTSITIPDGVTSIGSYAFYECSGLTSITIPDGVASIDYGAFDGCNSVTSITIGSGITSIRSWAFRGCSSMTDVFCHAENLPKTDSSAFDGSNIADATLHVQTASVEAYKNASPWNQFKEIVALEDGEHEKGDMSGDGKVDADDVVTLVNVIMGGDKSKLADADLNHDGKVDVADLTMLVNMILDEK